MKGTLLLDLDDTLLVNQTDTFLPAYLQAWMDFIAPQGDPERFIKAMLSATRQMAENPRLDCTLRQVFDEVFFAHIGIEADRFKPLEADFYAQVFPKLKSLTRPMPGAEAFVEQAFEQGYQVAIATNPYFPLTAIEQRLEWANLPVERYPFALVPSIETFHFGKPHPAFFAELLACLGWPEGPLVMVGDEPELDIRPADTLGLNTFWIAKDGLESPSDLRKAHGRGGFTELSTWLEKLTGVEGGVRGDAEKYNPRALLAILQSTPAALDSLSLRLSEKQWNEHARKGEWCPAEIVCHLRDVDLEVNIPRFARILEEDNPFLTGMDTDRWNQERNYHYQDGPDALDNFLSARIRLLKMLASLQGEDWQRVARHSILGRTDLFELVRIIAEHDQLHIRQFLDSHDLRLHF